jgi:methionyl aminopeptidase
MFWFNYRRDFGCYSIVNPGFVGEGRTVPQHINQPSYFDTSMPPPGPHEPEIKTVAQIKKMRESCRLARFILDSVGKYIKVSLTEIQNKSRILPLPVH